MNWIPIIWLRNELWGSKHLQWTTTKETMVKIDTFKIEWSTMKSEIKIFANLWWFANDLWYDLLF